MTFTIDSPEWKRYSATVITPPVITTARVDFFADLKPQDEIFISGISFIQKQ